MERILYFLSKTDQTVISHCSPMTRNIQASLGFFVLLTGTTAFISGTYAISNMFVQEDSNNGQPVMLAYGWPASLFFGLIYATFIMAIDREIVSASDKRAVIFRLPLAIIISLIIATPMEMQLFDAKLNKRLSEDSGQENKKLADDLAEQVTIKQARFDVIDSSLRKATDDRDHWQKVMDLEIVGAKDAELTGHSGKGPAYEQAKQNMATQDTLMRYYRSEIKQADTELKIAKNEQDVKYKKNKQLQSYDLLSKGIALSEVKDYDKSGTAWRMGLGITILFFLFETIPSIMKLLLPKTEYDGLIENRRRLNILAANMIFEEAKLVYNHKSAEEISKENPARIAQLYLSQSD